MNLTAIQIKELVRKNILADKRNPRGCIGYVAPLLLFLMNAWIVSLSKGSCGDSKGVLRGKDAPALQTYHRLRDSYRHDPINRIFRKDFRSGSTVDPCGSCDNPILLEGAPAAEFQAFAEALWNARLRNASNTCEVWDHSPECSATNTAFDGCRDISRIFAVLPSVADNAACAKVVWESESATSFSIRLNRTFGSWSESGEFVVWTSSMNSFESNYRRNSWHNWNRGAVTVENMKSKRCMATTNKLCEETFGKLYAPASWFSSDEDDSWFVELHLLLSEYAKFKKSKGSLASLLESTPQSLVVMPMPILRAAAEEGIGRYSATCTKAVIMMGAALLGVELAILFLGQFFVLVSRVIEEREERLKEGLRMMGTSDTAYYGHWFCTSMLFNFINAVLMFLIVNIVSPFSRRYPSIFFAMLFFTMDVYAMAYVVSCFFSVPRTGSLFGTLVFLLTTFLSFIPMSVTGARLFLLFPQVAWTKYVTVLFTGDVDGWFDDMEIEGGLTLGVCFGFLVVDFIILHALWVYLDLVIPHAHGNSLKPWFPCDPEYWRGSGGVVEVSRQSGPPAPLAEVELIDRESFGDASQTRAPQFAEPLPPEQARQNAAVQEEQVRSSRPSVDEVMSVQGRRSRFEPVGGELIALEATNQCVKVKDLCVYFRGANFERIQAVDGVSFTMYPGEIFALLGHNGAGKSTTMSVISGLLRPSAGEVKVFGLQVPGELAAVRKSMGFCPQHDVLFKHLTVQEHLELFCALAGRDAGDKEAMRQLVVSVGLGDRSNYRTTALSGGMKRKLSVGITFAGNPKLVILDEPTSGMDPFSRRILWDFLKVRKVGRVLLLTTHFMDEADVLGDRIAIMRAGQVQTCGSPQFLKRKFGCGYVLTVVMKEQSDSHEPVKNLVLEVLAEKDCHVEFSGVGKEVLVNVPLQLEARLPRVINALQQNKDAYSVATFGISVTNLEEVFLKVARGDHGSQAQKEEVEASFHDAVRHHKKPTAAFVLPNPGGTVWQQLSALLIRRAHGARRDVRSFMVGCLMPVVLIFGACALGALIVTSSRPSAVPLPPVKMTLAGLKVLHAVSGVSPPPGSTATALDFAYNFTEFTDGAYNCWEVGGKSCNYKTTVTASYYNFQYPWGYVEACKKRKEVQDVIAKYSDTSYNFDDKYCQGRLLKQMVAFGDKLAAEGDVDVGILEADGFPVIALNNTHVAHASPLAIQELYKAVGEMSVTNHILPRTDAENKYWAKQTVMMQAFASVIISILANFAFNMVPIAVLGYACMEKAKDVKHQLLISGCAARAYWLSMLLWDCLIALTPVLMLFVFLKGFGFEAFILYSRASILLLLLYVPAAVGLAYVLCQLFSTPAVGNMFLQVCNGVCALTFVFLFLALDVGLRVLPLAGAMQVAQGEDADYVEQGIPEPQMFMSQLIVANCTPIKDAFDAATQLNRTDMRTLQLGEMVSKCKMIWWATKTAPVVRTVGQFLPGFNLLDGLLRIAGRHALVYLGFPELLRLMGTTIEAAWSNGIKKQLKGCGSSLRPGKGQCQAWASQAQQLEATISQKGEVCRIDTLIGQVAAWVENIASDLLMQVEAISDVLGGVDLQVREAAPAEKIIFISGNGQTVNHRRRLQSVAAVAKQIEGQLALGLVNFLPDDNEKDAWLEFVECLNAHGFENFAFASLLATHGEAIGQKVQNELYKLALRPDIAEFADRVLPSITTTAFTDCTFGPAFGPWGLSFLSKLAENGKAFNNTRIGPIRVQMACNLGLQGGDIPDSLGNVFEVLIKLPTVGDSIYRLLIIALLFPLLTICLEDLQQSPRASRWFTSNHPCPPELLKLEDENVKAEKARVQQLDPRQQIMYVNGLRKVFGNGFFGGRVTHAVRGVTWAAEQGMVFGLLGVNGAGKTTSFKMMSGILTPSDGQVRILGIDIVQETSRARRFIGYCPQFDALIEKLTPLEHLRLYGRMKGLTGPDLSCAVDEKLSCMQLAQYSDRWSGSLSGGNKRKLSVAMALIGEPPVIFLDEPSTGMDPFARRFMWSVIQDVADQRKQSVVILTTHSMEEAEALCSNIAIQVDGQLRCFGSAQQLKTQYGQGYEVSAKFAPSSPEALQQQLQSWGLQANEEVPAAAALQLLCTPTKQAEAQNAMGPLGEGRQQVGAEILADWNMTLDRKTKLDDFLRERFGRCFVVEAHGSVSKLRLPELEASNLAQLLQDLQDNKANFGMSDFAVSQASLEQIFNAFAAEQEAGGNVGIAQVRSTP